MAEHWLLQVMWIAEKWSSIVVEEMAVLLFGVELVLLQQLLDPHILTLQPTNMLSGLFVAYLQLYHLSLQLLILFSIQVQLRSVLDILQQVGKSPFLRLASASFASLTGLHRRIGQNRLHIFMRVPSFLRFIHSLYLRFQSPQGAHQLLADIIQLWPIEPSFSLSV